MTPLRRRMLERLAKLRPGTTLCPGRLARDCGSTLVQARGDLMALASEGKIALSQRGKTVAADEIKGAFRVGSRRCPSGGAR